MSATAAGSPRSQADRELRACVIANGMPRLAGWAAWAALRLAGWAWWQSPKQPRRVS